jgi:Putative MetA-pathway of phenol degradation
LTNGRRLAHLILTTGLAIVCPRGARADWPELSSGPLQDNSFLLEEAYNQEAGVVQNIANGVWDRESGDWQLSFTQEWPVPDQRNQLSYTLLYQWAGDDSSSDSGLGPVTLNYRYQALTEDAHRPAFAPRLSVLLPTGAIEDEFGAGSTGIQIDLPLSKQLGKHWEVNLNLGGTLFPSAGAPDDSSRNEHLLDGSAGASAIWEPYDAINVLCEVLVAQTEEITRRGSTYHTHPLVNPGVRIGWNGPGGVQWVVGASIPIGFGGDAGQLGGLLYLSIEHAITAAARRERDW